MLVSPFDHAAEEIRPDEVGPSVGAAEGAVGSFLVVEEGRAVPNLIQIDPIVEEVCSGQDPVLLSATRSESGSSFTGDPGPEEDLHAWGKKEEYF
jgi:hypothetical protein